MATMLAVRARDTTPDIFLDKVEIPRPEAHEVLVRVEAAGLAPGILVLLKRGAFRSLPTTLGHEIAGTVAEVGPGVDDAVLNVRVRVHPSLTCRSCRYCLTDRENMCAQMAMIGHAAFGSGPMPLYERYHDGGMAEYVRVPDWSLDLLPDNISFAVAAKVQDIANAAHGLKAVGMRPGSTLVVTAATGTMGTATVRLAPLFGVGRLILVGRHANRLAAVQQLASVPADIVAFDELPSDWTERQGLTQRLRELVPEGADAVIDYLPSGPGAEQALWSLATGGALASMGPNPAPLAVPIAALIAHCWRVIGTRSCTRTDTAEIISLLHHGVLRADDLITHRWSLQEAMDGIVAIQSRPESMWMNILEQHR